MSPTEKAVLMAIADRADDAGLAWPGIPDLCEATCFSRRAVIAALKALDQDHAGLLVVERTAGRNNRMTVSLPAVAAALRLVVEKGKPSARREVVAALEWVTANTSTSASDAPVQDPHQCDSRTTTRAPVAPPPVHVAHQPVHHVHPNHQEPPEEPPGNHQEETPASPPMDGLPASDPKPEAPPSKTARAAFVSVAQPNDVDAAVWADWLTLRRAKRAPVTETVLEIARAEAIKAGMSLDGFMRIWCHRGTQGLMAEWIKPSERGVRSAPQPETCRERDSRLAAERFRDATGGLCHDRKAIGEVSRRELLPFEKGYVNRAETIEGEAREQTRIAS